MIRIEIDLFSGKPNPVWHVPDDLAVELLRTISENKGMISLSQAPSYILGFRGLIVTTTDMPDSLRFGLPDTFLLGDGQAPDLQASGDMTRILLSTCPEALIPLTEIISPLMERRTPFLDDHFLGSEAVDENGPNDVGPSSTTTIQDGKCSVEVGRYSPAFWNSAQLVSKNNCYSYGCNMRTNDFAQPGVYANLVFQNTLASIITCAKADGAVSQGNCMPQARQPRWLMALVTTADNIGDAFDFHWYRKQQEDYWGHKRGYTDATNRDNSGELIEDPQTCDRGAYTQWGGYFYAPKTMNIKGRATAIYDR